MIVLIWLKDAALCLLICSIARKRRFKFRNLISVLRRDVDVYISPDDELHNVKHQQNNCIRAT